MHIKSFPIPHLPEFLGYCFFYLPNQYPHKNSPNWSPYIRISWENLTKYQRFFLCDHFINSHRLCFWQSMDIVRRKLMLVSGISRGGVWAHPLFLNQAEAKAPIFFFFFRDRVFPLPQGLDDRASPLSQCLDLPLVGHYWDLRRVKKGILQYQESGICTKPKNENTRGELGLLFSVTTACKQAAEEILGIQRA